MNLHHCKGQELKMQTVLAALSVIAFSRAEDAIGIACNGDDGQPIDLSKNEYKWNLE